MPSLVKNEPSGSGDEDENLKVNDNANNNDGQCTNFDQTTSL